MNLDLFLNILKHPIIETIFHWIGYFWFLWIPAVLLIIFYDVWVKQKRLNFLANIEWILLEIKVPRDIFKSPKAMETILTSLYSASSEGSWWKNLKKGTLSSWYSLEITSRNGNIHFYTRIPKGQRNFVESQFYAQYPGAEIKDVDDYTYAANFEDLDNWNIWGEELALVKEDVYPLKTYVDFDLHMAATKEEHKINPLVSFIEFLGSLGDGEQIWFQVMIKGVSKDKIKEVAKTAKKEIDKLLGRDKKPEEKKEISKGEKDAVSAIEKSIAKNSFDTGIRVMYLARKDIFNKVNSASLLGLMNQYGTQNLNGFKPAGILKIKPFKFLFKNKREAAKKESMLDAYRRRGYFHIPDNKKSFVLTTEEIATIFHFPGRVAETPTLERIESKKGEPPITLPI